MEYTISFNMNEFISSISECSEKTSPLLNGHMKRVSFLSYLIGKKLNMNKKGLKKLIISSLIHDIGIISNYDAKQIFNFIFEKNSKHVEIAYLLLKDINFFKEYSNIIRFHHENWNYGKNNYPYESMIISVADKFDLLFYESSKLNTNYEEFKNILETYTTFNE
ncbi:hypothetical protein OSSY52_20630 [Tepiditoga spiralis]|uniref:HD domain-containing protein n=1 Tax=Tepiditoga spiralis TaxID=2108365 RepID=A0A7G1GBR8_9BACT|nr:HD domain-containing protein [Tepiditoga spiralis]BBE31922.1 hypothetical protein OSSY52_20630 [Tepiditoga spiralis]